MHPGCERSVVMMPAKDVMTPLLWCMAQSKLTLTGCVDPGPGPRTSAAECGAEPARTVNRESTDRLLPVAIELWHEDGSPDGYTAVYTPAVHKNVRAGRDFVSSQNGPVASFSCGCHSVNLVTGCKLAGAGPADEFLLFRVASVEYRFQGRRCS